MHREHPVGKYFNHFFLALSVCADLSILLSQLHRAGAHHPVSPEDNAGPKSHILVFIRSFKLLNSLLVDNNCSHVKTTDNAWFLQLRVLVMTQQVDPNGCIGGFVSFSVACPSFQKQRAE